MPTAVPGVVVHDHVLIPMADGARLSARIWLPADASDRPVPALLEYLPYRKGDWTAPRDATRHPWYAAHGYASVRVDIRGTGDSEGIMTDEYSPAELDDAMTVIAWLATQPWCTGKVGMFGISWGGFNALQVAARRPPALGAIVTVCSTDDRYADDVHYFGGSVLGIDMLGWASAMLAFTARPPDPIRVGDRWHDLWLERLDGLHPLVDIWLSHQERDDYWRRGSVCEDYAAITAPVLAVGGWADPYRDAVLRLVEHLTCPVKGLIGPWAHQYPDIDRPPGPQIGFLQETLRWWDRWLKDVDTGVETDPALRAWIQDSVRPATWYDARPGRWVTEPSWPSPHVATSDASLAEWAGSGGTVRVCSLQHTGADAGRYFPFGNPADLPPDQQEEDGRSLALTSAPLTAPVDILGVPVARLRVTPDAVVNLTVRLCDVAPDGSSTLITRGSLNLRKRDGMDRVAEVVPGQPVEVEIALRSIGWQVPTGHRIRLAVSTAYWPWVWPHPQFAGLDLDLDNSRLLLPVRDPAAPSEPVVFEPPEQSPAMRVEVIPRPSQPQREVKYDPESGDWTLTVDPNYGGSRRYPDGLVFDEQVTETYTINRADPLTARAESRWFVRLHRGQDWDASVDVHASMTADDTCFRTTHRVEAASHGVTIRDLVWTSEHRRTSC